MSTDKPTPRMDAFAKELELRHVDALIEISEFARQLERELAEAQTEIERAEAEVDSAYEILLSSVDLLPEKYLLYVNDLRAAAADAMRDAKRWIKAQSCVMCEGISHDNEITVVYRMNNPSIPFWKAIDAALKDQKK